LLVVGFHDVMRRCLVNRFSGKWAMHNDETAIRQLVATWLEASAAGDFAQVLQLMADDVVFLLPGQPAMYKADFAAAQTAQRSFDIKAESNIQEIKLLGDWAYCWNKLTVTMTPRDGKMPVKRAGDVLSILQKKNGRWVIVRDANMLSLVKE
jgi:uncharacterized protein (TIGR02246 family)